MSRRASTALPVIALLAALIALLAYGVMSRQPDRAVDEALADGKRQPAPSLTLPRLEGGGSGSLSDYHGEVVVLNYWASLVRPVPRGVFAAPALAQADRVAWRHRRWRRHAGRTVRRPGV